MLEMGGSFILFNVPIAGNVVQWCIMRMKIQHIYRLPIGTALVGDVEGLVCCGDEVSVRGKKFKIFSIVNHYGLRDLVTRAENEPVALFFKRLIGFENRRFS